ncbi:hypothetical protein IRJ41_010766 [Triplophysa rosa]|uniref:Uncharacterized protein n=1 Tax=Triplophysa rosa TaxID=992332 RepID=A0A9W7TR23_TRIRA|nr:hypothetical protein IRJ41_010766 [Triplophysa rosa]
MSLEVNISTERWKWRQNAGSNGQIKGNSPNSVIHGDPVARGTSCGFNNMKADTPSSPPSLGLGEEQHRTDEDLR